jgi:hypothetical protein
MTVDIPAQYAPLIQNAAAQLGLPVDVVAAQIQTESGFNPDATSPTGAQGLAQFEPGTWATYGTGSPTDPTAAMNAYVKYMSVLLQQFGGNVQNALAAYNAGPGNISAGMGYATGILSEAGQGSNITASGGTGTTGTASAASSPQTSQTVAEGGGSTCAFALGTQNKILIWNVGFSICVVSKTELRALIGALMMGGGAVVTMVGMALVLQYAMDKTGVSTSLNKLPGMKLRPRYHTHRRPTGIQGEAICLRRTRLLRARTTGLCRDRHFTAPCVIPAIQLRGTGLP